MDIFEKIAMAQSLSDDKRKQSLIPLLEDVISLATGEHAELSLDKKSEVMSLRLGSEFKQFSVKGDSASALVRDVFDNI
jgi:hypothetical protein